MISSKRKTDECFDDQPPRKRTATIAVTEILNTNEDQVNEQNGKDMDFKQQSSDMRESFVHGQYDKAIQQSSALADKLNTMLIKTIKFRMNVWKKKGDLVQQLRDAEILIETAPKDPIGYISAAYVFFMRGQQKQVIHITKEGMKNIPKTDSNYEMLSKQYTAAYLRSSRCIDFLGQLPYDLCCKIANYLPLTTHVSCLKVSRTWRDRVLNHPVIWRKCFTFDSVPGNEREMKIAYQVLPQVTRFVEKLELDHRFSATRFEKYIELLGSANFSSLKALHITTGHKWTNKCDIALSSIGDTLEEFTFRSLSGHKVIPSLYQILTTCRKLTSIGYYCSSNTAQFMFVPPSLPHVTLLERIELVCTSPSSIEGTEVSGLFKQSPHLRALYVQGFRDSSLLRSLNQWNPSQLIYLNINGENILGSVSNTMKNIEPNTRGLRHLVVHQNSFNTAVKPFLEKHQNTIQQLELVHDRRLGEELETERATDWGFLSNLTMSNLNELHIDALFLPHIDLYIPELLQHSPKLHTLHLKNCNRPGITKEFLESISDQISKFTLSNCALVDETATVQALKRLKRLHSFSIVDCKGTTDSILHAVGNISTLTEVEIGCGYNTKVTRPGMQACIDRLSRQKNLIQINFDSFCKTVFLDPDMFKIFRDNNSDVCYLVFTHCSGIYEDELYQVLPPGIEVIIN
ncbi:hypothetical protein BDC45DRAFT_504982 [Circinella umbellata]|nr:hypothetical protein BDC45DRAFT_504982 [Circinella umbellata]